MRSSVDENKQLDKTLTIEAVGWVASASRIPSLQLKNNKEYRFDNEHQIVGLLGEGASGKVYLAKIKRNGIQYAIKVIEIGKYTKKHEALEEAGIHRQLRHTNIVLCLQDSWIETQTEFTDLQGPSEMMYIPMEYIDGTTLLSQIEICMEPNRAWNILKQVAQVVNYLHEKGIAHCDLHAGNILIDDQGRVKVIDFGQAKKIESFSDEDRARVMAQDIASLASLAFDLHYGPFKSFSERNKKLQDIERRSITSREFPEGAFPSEEHVIESLIKQDYGNLREPQANKIEPEDILSESTNFFKYKHARDAISMGFIALSSLVLASRVMECILFGLIVFCFLIVMIYWSVLLIPTLCTFTNEIYETMKRKPEYEAAYRKIWKVVSRVTTLSV